MDAGLHRELAAEHKADAGLRKSLAAECKAEATLCKELAAAQGGGSHFSGETCVGRQQSHGGHGGFQADHE